MWGLTMFTKQEMESLEKMTKLIMVKAITVYESGDEKLAKELFKSAIECYIIMYIAENNLIIEEE